jgi:hypothetical protein
MPVLEAAPDEYKEKIFGKSPIKGAPQEYWNIGLVLEQGGVGAMEQWETMDDQLKAKILARVYLNNMVEVIKAHWEQQDEQKAKK